MTVSDRSGDALTLELVGEGHYRLAGRLGFTTAEKALGLLLPLTGGAAGLKLDLAGISSIDSAGLAVLLECWRRCRLDGGELILEQIPEQLQRLLRISDLEPVLGC